MRITNADFTQFLAHARKLVPRFDVHDGKEDSYLMNLIDGIVWPFNPHFMTRYITTVISAVYFPKGQIKRDPRGALEVAGHELVHAYDAQRLTFPVFGAWYLSAISLFVLAMCAVGVLISPVAFLPFAAVAVHAGVTALTFKLRKVTGFPLLAASLVGAVLLMAQSDGLSALWLAAASLLLAPWPAPGRTWAELRGYGMSIFLELKLFGKADDIKRKVQQFTGPAYYWMCPFAAWVLARLNQYEFDFETGVEHSDPVFVHVREFFDQLENKERP